MKRTYMVNILKISEDH